MKPNKKIISLFSLGLIFILSILVIFSSGIYTGRYLDVIVPEEDVISTTTITTFTTTTTIDIESFTKDELTREFCPAAMISVYGDDIFYHFINNDREMKFIDNEKDYYCTAIGESIPGSNNITFRVYREAKSHIFFKYYTLSLEELTSQ